MKPLIEDDDFKLFAGDCVDVLSELGASVDCCITSPPYMDSRPEYPSFERWLPLLRQLKRICKGPLAINVGRKFRAGEEMLWWVPIIETARHVGWKHEDTLVWIKANSNPIRGRLFADSHEYVLLLGHENTEWNTEAIRTEYESASLARFKNKWINGLGVKGDTRQRDSREPNEAGARPRSFVVIETGREKGNAHPAPMAYDLAQHLVKLCSWEGQTVLDPFAGSGTTCLAARSLGRKSVGIELDPLFAEMCAKRMQQLTLLP